MIPPLRILTLFFFVGLFPCSAREFDKKPTVKVGFRDWTNRDGKSFHASFSKLSIDENEVFLNTKDGRTFEVPVKSLSDKDQAILALIAMAEDLQIDYNEALNCNFIYPHWDEYSYKSYNNVRPYFGINPNGPWLRVTLYKPKTIDLRSYESVEFSSGGDSVSIPIDANRIREGESRSVGDWNGIDMSLPNREASIKLAKIFMTDNAVLSFKKEKSHRTEEISYFEKQALKTIGKRFLEINGHRESGGWKKAFNVFVFPDDNPPKQLVYSEPKNTELNETNQPSEKSSPNRSSIVIQRLLDDKGFYRSALLPTRKWTNLDGRSINGDLHGFLDNNIVIKTGNRYVEIPFDNFISENQQIFVEQRLKHSTHMNPQQGTLKYFFPKDWDGRTISSSGIYYTTSEKWNQPYMIIQINTKEFTNSEVINRISLRSDLDPTDYRFDLDDVWYKEGDDYVRLRYYVPKSREKWLYNFINAKKIFYRVASDSLIDDGEFSEAEVKASQESIRVFQWAMTVNRANKE